MFHNVSWNFHGLPSQHSLRLSSSNLAVNFDIHARVFSSAASTKSKVVLECNICRQLFSSLNCTTLYHRCDNNLFTHLPQDLYPNLHTKYCRGTGSGSASCWLPIKKRHTLASERCFWFAWPSPWQTSMGGCLIDSRGQCFGTCPKKGTTQPLFLNLPSFF